MKYIRNFSIIAHINHGKSTFADRIIQICGGLSEREMESQVLDSMDIERERGITIKAQTASLIYKSINGNKYTLNLIDTPGHVDFSYEVNRSLASCEGALLLVDASQGIEAQTVANYYIAKDLGIKIIPVLNKIDLLSANISKSINEINDIINLDVNSIICCSAKTGKGIKEILENIIKEIPYPNGKINSELQALVIDSWFDNYVGVVMLVRVFNGIIYPKKQIRLLSTQKTYIVENVGIFTPKLKELEFLSSGLVGFVIAGIKKLSDIKIGDTITYSENLNVSVLPGFKEIKPQVFAGLYPIESKQYSLLRDSLEKLRLNDSSIQYELEVSPALGHGYRCGFLGLLHMEIIQERLEREFKVQLITTAPTVIYQILLKDCSIKVIENPSKIPDLLQIKEIREPIANVKLYMPLNYLGKVIKLCSEKRGTQIDMKYHGNQVHLLYEIPMAEIIVNFFNRLKSISNGYASMEYEFKEYRKSDVVKIDVLINKNKIDALTTIIHRSYSDRYAKEIAKKMSKIIPRQMYDIAIQIAIGSRIISRENIKALRKNVLSKCYGGDITRKKKLLEKQKEGKKRMKQIGLINIPQEAFLSILSDSEKYN